MKSLRQTYSTAKVGAKQAKIRIDTSANALPQKIKRPDHISGQLTHMILQTKS